MRFGVTLFPTDQSIDVIELGREVEDRGLDSIWFPEHTHIPISRRTPPPTGEEVLAEEYRRCLDPLVALASVAGATSRLRLGTGIALVSQREPIVTAKAVASLDLVSGGRFSLGIGFGWNEDEMEDHGVAYATRREHARDHVLAMRRLWEDDEASYEGEFVRFPPTWSWPKPVQRPLPVLIGGMAGPKLFSHIA
ncbi:MAG: TIGR03619 family F420-dependent LLM class oxidoreductase, partial [Actinobacteria bacterium]|nr:TIGR03619 family F420-dependent LLM class oxidoreductase [Actinomycetota bacterium]